MATRIVSWGGNEHIVSPSLSKTPSIVSVDSILTDKSQTSPATQGAPRAAAESRAKQVASQVIEPNGTRTWTTAGMYPGPDAVDGSFVRQDKYFFTDGNVTFLVDNTLYCVHRYFFSRDSIYFSTRFALLNIRDHETLPTIISLGDIERKDFDAFLSVLYPENFEQTDLSYEEWKSVLHLSTRWGFTSIRKLALSSIKPPTPHDRLLLARKYSVDHWVVPALSALCERMAPLTLSEARGMDIEDVILVSTVREDIRSRTLRVDASEIPRRVEAEQEWALTGCRPEPIRVSPVFPISEPSSPMDPKGQTKEDDARESDGERSVSPSCSQFRRARGDNGIERTLQAGEDALGNISVQKEPAQPIKNSRGETAAMRTVETGAPTWTAVNIATQLADEVAAQHRVAKQRAKDAAVRREAGGPPGPWGNVSASGGWRVKPAAEKRTSDPVLGWWGTGGGPA